MITAADVVVVGSGAFGASAAYHLARRGARVVVLERAALASQTSPRAAGLSSQVRATPALTKLAQRAVAKLATFTADTGQPLRFTQSGALKIARTERDAEQLDREVARGAAAGVPIELVTVAEARRRLPILGERGIVAVTWSPTDCNVEPSELPIGYCRAAEKLGAVLLPHTPATGFAIGARGRGGGPHAGRDHRDPRRRRRRRRLGAAARHRARRRAAGGADAPSAADHRADRRRRPRVPDRPRDRRQRLRAPRARRPDAGRLRGRPLQPDLAALGPSFEMADLPLDIEVLWRLARSVREQFPIFQDPGHPCRRAPRRAPDLDDRRPLPGRGRCPASPAPG